MLMTNNIIAEKILVFDAVGFFLRKCVQSNGQNNNNNNKKNNLQLYYYI